MKGKKKILLAVALVLVMAVGITSIVVIRNRNKTVVKVFPVSMLNSSDWFDTDTSLTGTLTSDYIQEVHIDGGQKVKKVYVKKGDKVKPGVFSNWSGVASFTAPTLLNCASRALAVLGPTPGTSVRVEE